MAESPGGFTLLFRFVAGRHLWRDRRTDCTFLRRGTKPLDPKDRPPPFWEHWPEWYRAAYRLSGIALLISWVIYGLVPVLSVSSCCALLVAGTRSRALYDHIRTDQQVIGPLWKGLISMGVYPRNAKSRDYLTIPPDYRRNKDAQVTLRLPDDFEGEESQKKRVSRFVMRKLGGEWDTKWSEVGNTVLRLTHTPQAPRSYPFAQAYRVMKGLKDGQLLLGLNSRSKPVIIDLDKETPHVALSVGTGGGKSATLAFLIIQILAWGAEVFAIDPKRISLNPVKHLPGITIIRDIESQWDQIALFRAEMEKRYQILDENPDAVFPRWVLIVEESNTFYIDSVDYWATIRGRGEPAQPRVYRDLNASLNKGRQCRMNVISVFQRAEAAVCGGGAARSQYGYFLLGRYKKAEWKMFVDIWPWLSPQRVPGRMAYYDGEEYGYVQIGYAFDPDIKAPTLVEDATRFVLDRRPVSAASFVPVQRSQPSDGTELVNTSTPLRDLTLREAHDQGVLTGNLEAIRKDVQRNGWPKPTDTSGVSHRYSAADLVALEAKRTSNREVSVP